MQQLELLSVPSPCRGICQSDQQGYCRGCLRSRDERFSWQQLSNEQRRHVLALCKQRAYRRARARLAAAAPTQAEQTITNQGDLF